MRRWMTYEPAIDYEPWPGELHRRIYWHRVQARPWVYERPARIVAHVDGGLMLVYSVTALVTNPNAAQMIAAAAAAFRRSIDLAMGREP